MHLWDANTGEPTPHALLERGNWVTSRVRSVQTAPPLPLAVEMGLYGAVVGYEHGRTTSTRSLGIQIGLSIGVSFSPDGSTLATGALYFLDYKGKDYTVRLWDANTGDTPPHALLGIRSECL